MPDFDIRKSINGGLSFKELFIEIILISISVFLAFRWNAYIGEVINLFLPEGSSIIGKGIINIVITFILVWVAFKIVKREAKP